MSTSARFGLVLLFALVAAFPLPGCSGDEASEQPKLAQISESCGQAEPCAGGLTCAFSTCHAECATSRDCATKGGGLCVANAEAGRICQLPTETVCDRNSQCAGVQVCAADGRCHDACAQDTQCGGGQTCRNDVCADPDDVVGGGGAGGGGSVACLTPKDCKEDEACVAAVCKPR